MTIYAHRGWHEAPRFENSMAAFRHAADHGFGIETDLRTDRDGVIVLFHDRLVDGEPVDRLSHAEIERRSGRAVPTLEDLLTADLAVPLNLEVKTTAAWSALLPFIHAGLPRQVLVSSFIHAIAAEATHRHGLDAALLIASDPASAGVFADSLPRVGALVWDYNIVDPNSFSRCSERGFRNLVYGAVTPNEHLMLARLDCDVITDTPEVARRVRRDERGGRA